MANSFYKVLKGYTAQARWYAANMTGGETGDWKSLGWTRLANGAVKPIFEMADGRAVVILDGRSHLHAVVSQVPAAFIFTSEEAARAAQAGW